MSTLTIRKKSLKTWLHTDSVLGDFIISKFYFNADNVSFQIVEQGQSKRVIYNITDITLFALSSGGSAETFTTITELSLRLEALNYPAFQSDGQITSIANLISAGTNVTITGDGTEASPYVIDSSGGGGGSGTLFFEFLTDITATNPTLGKFKYNNATPASITNIYVSNGSEEGLNVSEIILELVAGNQLLFRQQDDSTKALLFEVSGVAVNNSGWFTIPVTFVSEGSGGNHSNNQSVGLTKFAAGGGDFIPLTGTEVDNPVTGAIKIQTSFFADNIQYPLQIRNAANANNYIGFTSYISPGQTNPAIEFNQGGTRAFIDYDSNFLSLSSNADDVNNVNNVVSIKGLLQNGSYLGSRYTNNSYIQKLYVDAVVQTANFTAEFERRYTTNGTITVTDPTQINNKGYVVHVIGGTTTIGGVGYTTGALVYRYYDGTVWVSTDMAAISEIKPLGKLKITNSDATIFTDLETARTWIEVYTSATKTNESFFEGSYYLDVPIGSDFSLDSNFCNALDIQVTDPYGCIGILGGRAFSDNIKDNVLQNVTAGNNLFTGSTGNNKMGNITAGGGFLKNSASNNEMGIINVGYEAFFAAFPTIKNTIGKIQSCGNQFAGKYTGRMDVGLFGDDGTDNLPADIFTSENLVWIITPYSNLFINGGSVDADILNIEANLANVDSVVNFQVNTGGGGGTWGSITGTLASQTDLQTALDGKVDENVSITGATKTKITYDAKGLVTNGVDATTADIADTTNKRYQTNLQQSRNDATSSIQTQINSKQANLGYTPENVANKQDSLAIDGTGVKYPTVDAVNAALSEIKPLGKLKITNADATIFTDLATARTWIEVYTSATKTNESFFEGSYYLDVPIGSDFSLDSNFCNALDIQVTDPYGCIGILANSAFSENIKDNVLKNVTGAENLFAYSSGNNKMGNITAGGGFLSGSTSNNEMGIINVADEAFYNAVPTIKNTIYKIQSCGVAFANSYTGRMDVGLFGDDGAANLPADIFTSANLVWLHTFWSNQFNNAGAQDEDHAGAQDGDIDNVISNLTNANKTIIFE